MEVSLSRGLVFCLTLWELVGPPFKVGELDSRPSFRFRRVSIPQHKERNKSSAQQQHAAMDCDQQHVPDNIPTPIAVFKGITRAISDSCALQNLHRGFESRTRLQIFRIRISAALHRFLASVIARRIQAGGSVR